MRTHASHRIGLNNYLQRNGGLNRLRWDIVNIGIFVVTWEAKAIIDGVVHGTGRGSSKRAAKENASEETLAILENLA